MSEAILSEQNNQHSHAHLKHNMIWKGLLACIRIDICIRGDSDGYFTLLLKRGLPLSQKIIAACD